MPRVSSDDIRPVQKLTPDRVAGLACWTSMPRASRSVVISTREEPERNSRMMTSRVFWSMSPCVADTVWSRSRILSLSQSTYSTVGAYAGSAPTLEVLHSNQPRPSAVEQCTDTTQATVTDTFERGRHWVHWQDAAAGKAPCGGCWRR